MNIDFKIGHQRERSFSETELRFARHHTWVAIGVGVAGAAAGAYGANKQSKATKAAASQNAASQDAQNASAWANYLMTRGLNPAGAATGQLPSNPQAINSRLPLWATANFAKPGSTTGWRKKTAAPGMLSTGTTYQTIPAVSPGSVPSQSGSGSSRLNDALIGNPLGIGGKDRNFLDPLGIF